MPPLVHRAVFPRWRPDAALRPHSRDGTGAALRVRWLGTAGHIVQTATTTILLDPFVSRPGLLRLAFTRLSPDDDAIRKHVPRKVDAICLGHSHFDHLLDAPRIATLTGARILGSRSSAEFARRGGVPGERITVIPAQGARVQVGDVEIHFVPSRHGRLFLGRVPFPGEVTQSPELPARVYHYRMGGAFGVLLRTPGATLYHNGSADLVDAELESARADVLLVGLAGRRGTKDYLRRLVGHLRPSVIIPTHHDAFFAPLEEGVRLLPGIDLQGFARDARDAAPRATLITPDYFEPIAIPAGDARGASIVGLVG